jgi:hypothetical protein
MNYIREAKKLGWVRGFDFGRNNSFEDFFNHISASAFADILRGHEIVGGTPGFGRGVIRPTPLRTNQEAKFSDLYAKYQIGLREQNKELTRKTHSIAGGVPYCVNLSTVDMSEALVKNGKIHLEFSEPIQHCEAFLKSIGFESPYYKITNLTASTLGSSVKIDILESPFGPQQLRQHLDFRAHAVSGASLFQFQAIV